MAKSDNSVSVSSDSSLSSSSSNSLAASQNSFGGGTLGANALNNKEAGEDIKVPAHEAIVDANSKGLPALVHPNDVALAARALSRDIADPIVPKAQAWYHSAFHKKADETHIAANSLLGQGQNSVASAAGNDLAEKIYVAQVDLKSNPKDMQDAAQKSVAAASAFSGAQAKA